MKTLLTLALLTNINAPIIEHMNYEVQNENTIDLTYLKMLENPSNYSSLKIYMNNNKDDIINNKLKYDDVIIFYKDVKGLEINDIKYMNDEGFTNLYNEL